MESCPKTVGPLGQLLNARQLWPRLTPLLPMRIGINTYRVLLASLPFVLLPGGRRHYYDLEEVLQALPLVVRRMSGVPEVVAAEPSLHRRRPRRHLAAS